MPTSTLHDTDCRLHEINVRAAMVRTVLDELERVVQPATRVQINAQLIEELGRLGARILETAGRMVPMPDSGAAAQPARVVVLPR